MSDKQEFVMVPREAVEALLLYAEAQTCTHEETHRVGAIWTICRACGRKWADDEGGFVPYQDPPEIAAAHAMLQAAPPAPAMHASAPTGMKCADCYMDKEACPTCYSAWWKARHPHSQQMPEGAPPAPAPISDEQLDELHGAMSDKQMTALARLRGGCSCHISPPCNACVEPLTEEEAISLGLLPDEPPPAPVAHSKSEYKRRVAMGDANVLPPAPVAVQPAPVAWQWRRKGDPWTLEKTFNSEVFATTADSEVRALYASPSPAPVAAPVVTDAQFYEWAEREGYGQSMLRTHAKAGWDAAILAAQSGAGTRGEQT